MCPFAQLQTTLVLSHDVNFNGTRQDLWMYAKKAAAYAFTFDCPPGFKKTRYKQFVEDVASGYFKRCLTERKIEMMVSVSLCVNKFEFYLANATALIQSVRHIYRSLTNWLISVRKTLCVRLSHTPCFLRCLSGTKMNSNSDST